MPTVNTVARDPARRSRLAAVLVSIASTALAVFLAERILKAWDRYQHDKFIDYADTWRPDGLGPGGYLRANFVADVIGEGDRLVPWRTNAQGLRYEVDLAQRPPAGTKRLLVVGDSFAAGYRTGQSETFAARAEAEPRRGGHRVEMPIAVVEEPVTGLFWLQQHGLALAPDGVLLTICLCNDIAQAYVGLHARPL
jgi:hypothetical protein